MKKIFLLLAIAFTSFITAQSNTKASIKERVTLRVKEIDKMVNLTDAQEKKLIALYSDKKATVTKSKSAKELQANNKIITNKLKAILTPEQFTKLVKGAKLTNNKEETKMPQ